MEMDIVKEDEATVAVPKGRVDGLNAGEFGDMLAKGIDASCQFLIIDFSEMVYISSAGLRVILSQAKTMRKRDGRLDICAAPKNILEVLSISGFNQILTIYDTRMEALEAI